MRAEPIRPVHPRRRASRPLFALGAALALCAACASDARAASAPVLPGGRFAFSYPNFNGTNPDASPEGYVQRFAGAKHNPGSYAYWTSVGRDIRDLNPQGEYFKHINVFAIDRNQRGASGPLIEGRPDYDWIHANHPEWLLRDAAGNTITLGGTDEVMDIANDAYLDWVLNSFLPDQIFDAIDREPGRTICLQQDNGYFWRFSGATIANAQYDTDDGVQAAWVHYLSRAKARWPNLKLIVSTGPRGYLTMDGQLAVFERVLGACDGYYGESLVDRHSYWAGSASSGDYKRVNLRTTLALAKWLADNGKVFMPNDGQGDGVAPTQGDTDYSWAFFNLLRQGDEQYYAKLTQDATGQWVPHDYPEMDLALGQPLEDATEITPDVMRRRFERAIAYVNMSDATTSIALPDGVACTDSRGNAVASPLVLPSFSGLTVYHAPTSTVTLVSVTPTSGSGSSATFTATVADSAGAGDVATVYVTINDVLSDKNGCAVAYETSTNVLSLIEDDTYTDWSSGVVGSATVLGNRECSIDLSRVSATVAGTTVTLTVPVTFTPAFAGTRTVYLAALDRAMTLAPYTAMGAWTIPSAPVDTAPPVISGVSAVRVTGSTATIAWTTDEPSDSQVQYGRTTSYGSASARDATLVTAHSVTLTGLSRKTTYHYRVLSRDAAGNLATSTDARIARDDAATTDYTFTTTDEVDAPDAHDGSGSHGCGAGAGLAAVALAAGLCRRRGAGG